ETGTVPSLPRGGEAGAMPPLFSVVVRLDRTTHATAAARRASGNAHRRWCETWHRQARGFRPVDRPVEPDDDGMGGVEPADGPLERLWRGRRAYPRRAASMAATSILRICIIASKARLASAPPAAMA